MLGRAWYGNGIAKYQSNEFERLRVNWVIFTEVHRNLILLLQCLQLIISKANLMIEVRSAKH
jgi:hypothetical protein